MVKKLWSMWKRFITSVHHKGLRSTIRHGIQSLAYRCGILTNAHYQLIQEQIIRQSEHTVRVERLLDNLTSRMHEHAMSIQWLAKFYAELSATLLATYTPTSQPLVSIIMPTWNRAGLIKKSITSVLAQSYQNWELLIIDDGSTDNTREVIANYLTDPRIHYFYQTNQGVSAARNKGLIQSQGEIITYLDSDNTWFPYYLMKVVQIFETDTQHDCIYFVQLLIEESTNQSWIRGEKFDYAQLKERNYIDINIFAHRRYLIEKYGLYDETIKGTEDWDFILRYTAEKPALLVPELGGSYMLGAWERVTTQENAARNTYLVQRKFDQPIKFPLRVLYILHHYPQLSESYIQAEMDYMQRMGVSIEVWSEVEQTPAPYPPTAPVHHGSLEKTIEKIKPDVVHVHWLLVADHFQSLFQALKVPITIRSHSFDMNDSYINNLQNNLMVKKIYLFPYYAAKYALQHNKIRALNVGFNPDFYYVIKDKDPYLVLRAAPALNTKDLEAFIQIAKLCPKHRFVLILAKCSEKADEEFVSKIADYNRTQGSPVEIRVNVQREEVSELMRRAGIYVHTHDPITPYGMPISIAEAMASGCYVIARERPPTRAYLGRGGVMYNTPQEAAALIRDTENWTSEQWRSMRTAATDQAYHHFVDRIALRPILDDWMEIVGQNKAKNLVSNAILQTADVD